jgi:hypothetical protein
MTTKLTHDHSALRRQGLTLLETTIAATVSMVLLGAVSTAFSALTRGATEFGSSLSAHAQNQRARTAFMEELQMADTLSLDEAGVPLFQIVDVDGGTQNSIVLRRVEGFEANPGEDAVTMVYGEPVQYRIDGQNNLVREQAGVSKVVARHVKDLSFERNEQGVVLIHITSFSGRDEDIVTQEMHLRLVPRNILSI